jgi:hypothetical protein
LTGLNEEELDRFILSEDEVKIKERVWVELNRDYLEALAGENFSFDLAMILLTTILLIQPRVDLTLRSFELAPRFGKKAS